MQLEEGQIYEGSISISGDDGPFRRWIVVSPFGKTHIHCLDEPLHLRCWPAMLVEAGVQSGRLHYTGTMPDHPIIQVQRVKESLGVRDAHLGVSTQNLQRLLDTLRQAVRDEQDYAPYLAGEILAAADRTAILEHRHQEIQETVMAILDAEQENDHQELLGNRGDMERNPQPLHP